MRRHAFAALATAALALPALAADRIGGPVTRVVDGDTFEVGVVRVRLWGVDAPEHDQPGGTEARAKLVELLRGHPVACEPKGRSRARVVARCMVDGHDLAEMMAAAGYALDWPKFSGSAYAKAERQAKAERAGLWADGEFMAPWLWRDRHGREPVGPPRR